MHHYLVVLCLLTFNLAVSYLPASAVDRAYFPVNELIGRADLVVLATVQTIDVDQKVVRGTDGREARFRLHIDDILKGSEESKLLIARCLLPVAARAVLALDSYKGQQCLFFLQRSQHGYFMLNGSYGILPAGEVNRVRQLITANPLEVRWAADVPMILVGQLQQIPVKVRNRGEKPIEVYGFLEGFFERQEDGAWLVFDMEVEQQCLRIRMTLKPGEEQTLTLICRAEQHGQVTDAKADAPALLRAVILLSDYRNGFYMSSSWMPTNIRSEHE